MSKKSKEISTKHDDETEMNKPSYAGRDEFVSGVEIPANVGRTKEDWIANQLRKVYDDAVNEDVPDEMMALLSQLDDQDAGSEDDNSNGGGAPS